MAQRTATRKWSAKVTKTAMLSMFGPRYSSRTILIGSLHRSAERSRRRKTAPFQSAMSMLTFYINRAGENLPAARKRTLQKAKDSLRRAFGRR